MNSKINRIARKLVIAAGENVLDDYFTFYSDGAWTVQIIRNLLKFVNLMILTPGAYITNISKIDEYIGYLSDVKLDDMNTNSAVQEIKQILKDVKKDYDKYEELKEEEKETEILLQQYNNELEKLKVFLQAYEKSCVNVFNTRYIEDEDNVNSLLQIIHEKGNYVFNKKGEK